jgi:hypothetical protein
MTIALTTITNAIAGLTISGVTIRDMHDIPNAVAEYPILYPEPVNFIADLSVTRMAQITAATSWNVEYTLTYTFMFAPLGSGRGMDLFSPMLTKAMVVVDAIIAAVAGVSGAVTCYLVGIATPGPMSDPSGNQFFGTQIRLRIMEMIN